MMHFKKFTQLNLPRALAFLAFLAFALPALAQSAVVTSQPQAQVVTVGQTATFSVVADGTPPLTYQWFREKPGQSYQTLSGATGTSYTTLATTLAYSGYTYYVRVTSGQGTFVFSDMTSTLTVTTDTLPVITTQPVAATRTVGQSVTFTVVASGTPKNYRWKKNNVVIPGATAASYTFTPASVQDSGDFKVEVYNQRGTAISNSVHLRVNGPPVITTQPVNRTVSAGMTASFSAQAVGSNNIAGDGALSYQWFRNGSALSGATLPAYTTPATTGADNGAQFTVRVTNTYGNVTSNAAILTVNTAPEITQLVAPTQVYKGLPASYSVSVAGTPPFAYQWKKNGNPIPGKTANTFVIDPAALADAGYYSVSVSNALNTVDSQPTVGIYLAVVTPTAPAITGHPADQEVLAGQNASFTVSASGDPAPTFQWRRNGAPIAGATGATYTPTVFLGDDGSSYDAVATNFQGSAISNPAILTVTSAGTAPTISTEPQDITVAAGQPATFSVTASGTAPFTYAWYQNGSTNGPASSATFTVTATPALNGIKFLVIVTNAAGNDTSREATLTVSSDPVGVTIAPASLSLGAGDAATFAATVTLTPNTAVTWSVQEGPAGGSISPAGVYNAPAAAGTYHVVATSQADPSRFAVAAITVLPKSHLPVRP